MMEKVAAVALGIIAFLGMIFGGCGSGAPAGGNDVPVSEGTQGGEGYDRKYSDEMAQLQAKEVPVGTLIECYISDSGNEFGNIDRKTLSRGEDGGIYLTAEYAAHTSDPREVTVYRADDDAMDQILAIIREYNFPAWDDLPPADEFALDGSVTSVGMIFDNEPVGGSSYEDYGFSGDDMLPPDGWDAIRRYESCLTQWMTKDRLVSKKTEKPE